MNTFYHIEGDVYETLKEAERVKEQYKMARIDEVETDKDFSSFEAEYERVRKQGNSIEDSLSWAKSYTQEDENV